METLKAIAARRSVRAYKPGQIPEDALEKILLAANAAPVGMKAYNSIHLTVIKNTALQKKISDAAANAIGQPDFNVFYGAPAVILISSRIDPSSEGISYANSGCIAQNILLAATDLGIASVYVMSSIFAFKADASLLNEAGVPDGYIPLASVALGYSAEDAPAEERPERVFTLNFAQ
jgi:nitroreductase